MTVKSRILVVDDDVANRLMIRTVLADDGYAITETGDGAAAVAAVESRFYDLVLMALKTADTEGLEALRRIRNFSAPGIPIIIISADASPETAMTALKAGASDYLSKPVQIIDLRRLVGRSLEDQS
jgi:two-component system response regulator HydG